MTRLHYSWFICAGGTLLLFCTVGLNTSAFSVYQPYMIAAGGLSNTQGSEITTLRSLAALLSFLLVEGYYRRTDLRLGVTLAAVGSALAFVLFGLARDFAGYCLAAIVAGVAYGFGGMIPVSMLIDRWFRSHKALALGIRDYFRKQGFSRAVLGLSGGIDSALSAAVAVDALGADRVWCVMLPSRFTSQESLDDAAACARMLGCRLDTVPIGPAVDAFDTMLAPSFAGRAADLTEENIQSRARAVTLMALSNKFGHMLLTTGNKSEMSVGYATIYGDMAGGYSVLKDAYKTTVFDLSRWRNAARPSLGLGPDGPVMPERVITKPPTAELRDNQKDSDSLPPYEVLDPILYGLVEQELAVDQLVARGFERETVARIERLLYAAEYKRRQSPPGVKLGGRNFGRDRRYPITNAFRTAS